VIVNLTRTEPELFGVVRRSERRTPRSRRAVGRLPAGRARRHGQRL